MGRQKWGITTDIAYREQSCEDDSRKQGDAAFFFFFNKIPILKIVLFL